jgi:hypothetical protein
MKKLLLGAALSFAACIPPGCIARGARVRTPRGSRPIEDLEVGDEVLCVDPELGVTHATRITWRRVVQRECLTLSFDGGALQCTSDHPLYCPTSKGWHPAGDWALGKRTSLLQVTSEGQRVVEVTSVSTFSGVHDVFDLTVEHPLHNFVADGVLVHNKQPPRVPCADGGVLRESCQCQSSPGTGFITCDINTNGAVCSGCAAACIDNEVCTCGSGQQGRTVCNPVTDSKSCECTSTSPHTVTPDACPRVVLGGPLPQVFDGDTTGLPNTLTSSRLEWGDAPDDLLQFTAPEAGNYLIELTSTVPSLGVSAQDYGTMGTDARVFTVNDCPSGTSPREINGVFNHNQPGNPLPLTAGQKVMLFVSAPTWANLRFGPYTLTVRKVP